MSTAASAGATVMVDPGLSLYPYGTAVRLTAVPQAGNSFAVWGNAGSGTNNPLLYTITASNRTVSAAFGTLGAGQAALTVVVDGFGAVTQNPRGNRFSTSQVVTLTATPVAGQQFLGWSGDASGAQNPLTLMMTSSRVITPRFTKRPKLSFLPCVDPKSGEPLPLWLTGRWGVAYGIERAPDVTGPWARFLSVTNQLGRMQFQVPAVTNGPAQFYRAVGE